MKHEHAPPTSTVNLADPQAWELVGERVIYWWVYDGRNDPVGVVLRKLVGHPVFYEAGGARSTWRKRPTSSRRRMTKRPQGDTQ